MLALEIRLNGELKATCGTEDADFLAASIRSSREGAGAAQESNLIIECVGVRPVDVDHREVLKWVAARIRLGDEVSFRFVEATQVQDPIDRQLISSHREPPDA